MNPPAVVVQMRVEFKATRSPAHGTSIHTATLESWGDELTLNHSAADHLEPGKTYRVTFEEVQE